MDKMVGGNSRMCGPGQNKIIITTSVAMEVVAVVVGLVGVLAPALHPAGQTVGGRRTMK